MKTKLILLGIVLSLFMVGCTQTPTSSIAIVNINNGSGNASLQCPFNGSVFVCTGDFFITSDLSVDELVVRNSSSIVIGGFPGGNPFSTISAVNQTPVPGASRITLSADRSFTSNTFFNGTAFFVGQNLEDCEFCNHVVASSDFEGSAIYFQKNNINYSEDPRLSQIVSDGGNTEWIVRRNNMNLTENLMNITPTSMQSENELRIGFFSDTNLSPDINIRGYTNKTYTMRIREGEVNINDTLRVYNNTELYGDFLFSNDNENSFLVAQSKMTVFHERLENVTIPNSTTVDIMFKPFEDGFLDPFGLTAVSGPTSRWWQVTNHFTCNTNPCASSRGWFGVNSMEVTDLNSTDLVDLNLNFYVGSSGFGFADNCYIDITYDGGTSWNTIVTVSSSQSATFYNFTLNSSYEDITNLGMRAYNDAGNNGRCSLDDVILTGVSDNSMTVNNVTRFDTTIFNTDPDVFIKYNDSSNVATAGHGNWEVSNPLILPDMDKTNLYNDENYWECNEYSNRSIYWRSTDLYACMNGVELKVSLS